MAETEPPAGFAPSQARGPFTSHNGPVYERRQGEAVTIGLRVLKRHCNGLGFLHGGMMSAFCDSALAHAVFGSLRRTGVTLKLSVEFYDIVREGDWIEAAPELVFADEETALVRTIIRRGEGGDPADVARATATFRLLRRRAQR